MSKPSFQGRYVNGDPSLRSRRAVDTPDFMAVILVGYGDNLYPLKEGTNALSKALFPVGNKAIINTVLDWTLEAGITDILILAPPPFLSPLAEHLTEHYPSEAYPRLRLDLKGHNDGEREDGGGASGGADVDGRLAELDHAHDPDFGAGERMGTGRLLRGFRRWIDKDFVLLPCDLAAPPWLSLASVLDKHRTRPETVLTAVLYEPIEAVKEEEEKLLIATDEQTKELLLIQPLEGLEEEIDLRMALITSHPTLSLSTRMLDAHIYIFRREVLDLLMTRRPKDLASMREQIVPWLIKGGWQSGLNEQWSSILSKPKRDPFAAALARSTTTSLPSSLAFAYPTPESSPTTAPTTLPNTPRREPSSTSDKGLTLSSLARLQGKGRSGHAAGPSWTCQYIAAVPPPAAESSSAASASSSKSKKQPQKQAHAASTGGASGPGSGSGSGSTDPEHLVRANTLAGYWELNRRAMKQAAIAAPPRPPSGAEDAPVHPTAQVSSDSLVGDSTRMGEKASVKKSVIGRHCNIGKGAKITGCILWDFVTVEENARLENCILCSNVRIGEKAQIKDCEFGTGYEAAPNVTLKNERLVAGQEA